MKPTQLFQLATICILLPMLPASGEGQNSVLEGTPPASALYRNSSAPVEQRINDLLGRMTLAEKIGQLCLAQSIVENMTDERRKMIATRNDDFIRREAVGAFLDNHTPSGNVEIRNQLQKVALEKTRLGVPLIFGFDAIHGFRTGFPIPLGQASAWEPDLFERTMSACAFETSAAGMNWAFSPMVDLVRDPRWGRVAESFGEDPFLGQLYAAASVKGLQGSTPGNPRHVAACLKHFVGYGAAEGGRDYNTTDISEYALRNFYLPAFKAGVDAGALTLMSGFNCLSGVPTSANHHTLTDILRSEWGFAGFVVSDWDSVSHLKAHGIAADNAQCARLAVTAGVDMEMNCVNYSTTLEPQVKANQVSLAVIDEAVRRVLRVKFQLGLFEHPYTDPEWQKESYLLPASLSLAREAAQKSCVLLKNERNILPLNRNSLKIALIGPLAKAQMDLLGCWHGHAKSPDVVSLEQGIIAKLGTNSTVQTAYGCDLITEVATTTLNDATVVVDKSVKRLGKDNEEITKAVKLAAEADLVVLALGEPWNWCGENASRAQLGLPGRQQALFDAVASTGKPVVVVLFNGRPLAIPEVLQKASAVLEAWQPGAQGGNAVADILFGDVSPSGRLTMTFPRAVGQVPIYYNHLNTGMPGGKKVKYKDYPSDPLFPFGFGLTYGEVEYGDVSLNAPTMTREGWIEAATEVQNKGSRAIDEVVQLYIQQEVASRARPVRELKGFQKIHLAPGEKKRVVFKIAAGQLSFLDESGKVLLESGSFNVWIAPNALAGKSVSFDLKD